MGDFMITLGTMSWQAGIIIAVVLVLRKIFEKLHISKKYMMLLWAVPFFCLLCPWKLSVPNGFWKEASVEMAADGQVKEQIQVQSLPVQTKEQMTKQPLAEAVEVKNKDASGMENTVVSVEKQDSGATNTEVKEQASIQTPTTQSPAVQTGKPDINTIIIRILGIIWGIGVLVFLSCNIYSYIKLKRKLVCSIKIDENVYMGDEIVSPMVVGIFRPHIYIPTGLPEEYEKYVLAHEKTHIKRFDTIYKIIVYIITCMHWFNPVVWCAFYLFSKDMEMTCDEETVRLLGIEEKEAYARALLEAASGKMLKNRIIFAAPVAFEEGNVKSRIKNIMKYQKTVTVVAICAVLVCVLVAAVFMTKEKTETKDKAISEKEAEEYFLEFIEKVKAGLQNNFQSVSIDDLDISSIFQYGAETDYYTLGYAFVDLDADGVDELLFGENAKYGMDSRIYGIYAIWDGKMIHVADGGENSYFFLCENGAIANQSATGSAYAYYTYKDGGMELQEALVYNKEKDNVQPWFYNTEKVSSENADSVRIAQVCEITNSYTYKEITYTPFENNGDVHETETLQVDYADNDSLTFSDLEGVEFQFYSGAGGWQTTVNIGSDGTFRGYYQDGEVGSGYLFPDGYHYECTFSGQFSSMEKTDPYEYTMRCETLEVQEEPGTEKIVDNYLLFFSEPYGFDEAGEFKLYLPGKAATELPEGFLSWSDGKAASGNLECYGLYNVGGKEGFVGSKKGKQPARYDYSNSNPTKFSITPLTDKEIEVFRKKYPEKESVSFSDLAVSQWSALRGGVYGDHLNIMPDGTFNGSYVSDEPSSVGEGYPNGTRYECYYSGQLSSLTKTAPYEFRMKCETLEVQGTPGEEKIVDGVRIITTEPYGFCNADELVLYLPGTRILDFPEGFLKWNHSYREDGVMGGYMLYNPGAEVGFLQPVG